MNSKRILFVFASVLLICGSQDVSIGGNVDVNGDGVVDTADLVLVDGRIGEVGAQAADVNDDNIVNITDLVLVKNAIDATTNIPTPENIPTPDLDSMVLIPAGEFQMGSNNGRGDEEPVHSVYVSAFYMDKYEVTHEEYARFLNAKGKHAEGGIEWLDLNDFDVRIEFTDGIYRVKAGYESHPVVEVTWYGAMAYAAWIDKRLPTEAEWEKAAQGRLVGKEYPWGDTIDPSKANYDESIGDTISIGSYPPNAYGLYDMAGNVWEWCLDERDSNFYENSPRTNPIAGAVSVNWILENYTNVSTSRILRGGSWARSAARVRVSGRYSRSPTYASEESGFRCVRDVSP